MKNNMFLYICNFVLIIHFISTFFMKEESKRKLFLKNYLGKKYEITNDELYSYSKRYWYVKQVLVISVNFYFLGLSIDTFLISKIVLFWILIDQCLRTVILIYGKKNVMIKKVS